MNFKIYVPSVGDGLSAGIQNGPGGRKILLDCGSQQGGDIPYQKGMCCFSPDVFILSHFHTDHYNGLFAAKKNKRKFSIQDVIFPVIPEFNGCEELVMCMMAMNFRLLGDTSGSMEYDFLSVIREISSTSFKYHAVSKGDVISVDGSNFKILWPPNYIKNNNFVSSVKKAIEKFNAAKQIDPILRVIYEVIFFTMTANRFEYLFGTNHHDRLIPLNGDSGDNLVYEKHDSKLTLSDDAGGKGKSNYPCAVPKETSIANKALRGVANRISLAFMGCDMLFMGDLEANEINIVVNELNVLGKNDFHVMIAPHHGTHWGHGMCKLNADIVVSSVGKKLCGKVKPAFRNISKKHHITYFCGDFDSSMDRGMHSCPFRFCLTLNP